LENKLLGLYTALELVLTQHFKIHLFDGIRMAEKVTLDVEIKLSVMFFIVGTTFGVTFLYVH
jgi:hypothetical protein